MTFADLVGPDAAAIAARAVPPGRDRRLPRGRRGPVTRASRRGRPLYSWSSAALAPARNPPGPANCAPCRSRPTSTPSASSTPSAPRSRSRPQGHRRPGPALAPDRTHRRWRKRPYSGAGHPRHPLFHRHGRRRHHHGPAHLIRPGARAAPLPRLHGTRAAANGTITLDSTPFPPEARIGAPGDDLGEPFFSTGARCTMTYTRGTQNALSDAVHTQMRARTRLGAAATGPVRRTAGRARTRRPLDRARRAAGARFGRFVRPNPVKRLLHDLATYLRQPAPDAVLAKTAPHALQ